MVSAPRPAFVDHCLELLAPLGRTRARRMFGGWGLYADALFVALIVADRLYLKADDGGKAAFAAAGCTPFVHDAAGKTMTMGYWTVPDAAMDSPDAMLPWARLALRAAVAAQAGKPAVAVPNGVKPPATPSTRAARPAATSAPARPTAKKPRA